MDRTNKDDRIKDLIDDVVQSDSPSISRLSQDDYDNLEQNLNIYHSELVYQNSELNRINEELQASERRYADLYNQAPVAYLVLKMDGMILSSNQTFSNMIHKDKGEIYAHRLSEFLAPRSQDNYYFFMQRVNKDRESIKSIELYVMHDEKEIPTRLYFNIFRNDNVDYIRATVFDLSETNQLMEELEMEKERYLTIAKQSHDILFEYDIEKDTMFFSMQYQQLTGNNTLIENFQSKILHDNHIYPEDFPKYLELFDRIRSCQKFIKGDLRLYNQKKEALWFHVEGTLLQIANKSPRYVGTLTNVDVSVKEKEALMQAAQHDILTKLLNKGTAQDQIVEFLRTENDKGIHALMILDINDFKSVNDHYGHVFGDAVLMEIASNLTTMLGQENIIGRLGGDEFIIFLKNGDMANVEEIANKVNRMVEELLVNDRVDCKFSSCIGIARYPQNGKTFVELFHKADLALYEAKLNGYGKFEFYHHSFTKRHKPKGLMNTYQLEDAYAQRHYADMMLVTNIIELLFGGKKLDSTIALILSLLGNHYQVSHACITLYDADEECAKVEYEWYMDKNDERMKPLKRISKQSLENYSKLFNEDGLLCCYDTDIITEGDNEIWEAIQSIEGSEAMTYLQCAIKDKGKMQGFISLDDFESRRVWSVEECNSFKLLSHTISSFLMQSKAQQRSEQFQRMDVLTNVWNYTAFREEAIHIMKQDNKEKVALISIDIHAFKNFNNIYGYIAGDHVLQRFALLLRQHLNKGEMVSRPGSDIFLMLWYFDDEKELHQRVKTMSKEVTHLELDNHVTYDVQVNVGVYLISEKGEELQKGFDRARMARDFAKQQNKTIAYFEPIMELEYLETQFIENHMKDALQNEEFFVVYQPKICIPNGKLIGAEALVRWKSPLKGMMYPDRFIPVLEKSGFIVELDLFVLEQACKKIHALALDGKKIAIAVNFSRMHIYKKDSILRAMRILDRWNVAPDTIEIEITEEAFIDDIEILKEYIDQLHVHGFRVAMDDFGSGFSSLNQLKDIPIDTLKLDREFLHQDQLSEKGKIVIEGIVSLARNMGLNLIAEGVETKEQANFLKNIKCENAQGYVYAKPLPEQEFDEYFMKHCE